MGKKKLIKYAGAKGLDNIIQPEVLDYETIKLKEKWNSSFFKNDNEIIVELGCGKGEYTLALARKYPDKNFIGIDIKSDRMFFGANTAKNENLDNVCFIRIRIEFLTSYFPPGIFSEGWITFPDPYESNLNGKRRLTSARFLDIYSALFKSGSHLYLKTDSRILYEFSKESLSENNCTILSSSDDLYSESDADPVLTSIQTKFEKRYLNRAVNIKYIKFSLKSST